jgi:hypothetical protein
MAHILQSSKPLTEVRDSLLPAIQHGTATGLERDESAAPTVNSICYWLFFEIPD